MAKLKLQPTTSKTTGQQWERVALVFIGGGLGAITRYGTALLASRLWGAAFPWGTLAVNLAGCLLIGVCFALADQKNVLGPSLRLFLMTGFLGGLTTFSSFGLESVNLARTEAASAAVMNVAINNVGGLVLVLVGMWLVRMLY